MKRPVILRSVARVEMREAYDWYEERRPGTGAAFVARVEWVFDRISANPRMHRMIFGNVRRAVVPVYPFCVYYAIVDDTIDVISVFHASRDPADWQRRV